MPSGIQVFDSSGNQVFDSNTAKGGVIAGHYTYAAGSTDTLTYPDFAGRSVLINVIYSDPAGAGVTTDTSLGYPRVTVSASGSERMFQVMIA